MTNEMVHKHLYMNGVDHCCSSAAAPSGETSLPENEKRNKQPQFAVSIRSSIYLHLADVLNNYTTDLRTRPIFFTYSTVHYARPAPIGGADEAHRVYSSMSSHSKLQFVLQSLDHFPLERWCT